MEICSKPLCCCTRIRIKHDICCATMNFGFKGEIFHSTNFAPDLFPFLIKYLHVVKSVIAKRRRKIVTPVTNRKIVSPVVNDIRGKLIMRRRRREGGMAKGGGGDVGFQDGGSFSRLFN